MYLYIIQCVQRKREGIKSNPVKIGYTKNLPKRIQDLQVGSPYPLRYICAIKLKSEMHAKDVELRAHKLLRKHRMSGEWFHPRVLQTEFIISLLEKCKEQKDSDTIPDISLINANGNSWKQSAKLTDSDTRRGKQQANLKRRNRKLRSELDKLKNYVKKLEDMVLDQEMLAEAKERLQDGSTPIPVNLEDL